MLKIDRIVSVSSEDPAWPAENLLRGEGKNVKWKTRCTGEQSACVELQLCRPARITSIDIGNEASAFVEILVGKSCVPDQPYKVLLIASSLMTPKEAKSQDKPNGVRFFKLEDLSQAEAKERWDRVKAVLTQPFNHHVQYGLSFIRFHGEAEEPPSKPADPSPSLGRFAFKQDADDGISVGSIFARRKELQNTAQTSAVSIRAASSQSLSDEPAKSPHPPKKLSNNIAKKDQGSKGVKRSIDPENSCEVKKKRKNAAGQMNSTNGDTSAQSSPRQATPSPRQALPTTRQATPPPKQTPPPPRKALPPPQKAPPLPQKAPPPKRRNCKPFSELLRGVVFTISGFQNPLRGEIRSKALAMGAKYRPDWDSSCSHLVCAFQNTPKFNQVKGVGKIVKKEWVEECHSRRMRIPWRRFALDPPEAKKPESDEEIFEGDNSDEPTPSTSHVPASPSPSLFGHLVGSDKGGNRRNVGGLNSTTPKERTPKRKGGEKGMPATIEEAVAADVEEVTTRLSKQKAEEDCGESKVHLDLDLCQVEEDFAEGLADTESELEEDNGSGDIAPEDGLPDSSEELSLPYLPRQFDGLSFYVADDLPPSVAADLKRYIQAHSGRVEDSYDADTEYIIAENAATVDKVRAVQPNLVGVRPEWVWRCHDENRLLPTSTFEL